MELHEIIIISVGAVLLVASIVVAILRYEKKRRMELEEFARYQGFSFQRKGNPIQNYGKIKIFDKGHRKKISNRVYGSRSGIQFEILDYQFTEGGGQNSATRRQTVAVATVPGMNLPAFYLAPENVFHRIGKKFGMQDINFDHFPDFSAYYLLKGEDEPAIRKVFKASVLEFFQGNKLKQSLEGQGDYLVFYRMNKREKGETLPEFFEKFRHIVSLINRKP